MTDNKAESIIKRHLYEFNADNNLIDDVLSSGLDYNYDSSLENKFNNPDTILSSLIDSYVI